MIPAFLDIFGLASGRAKAEIPKSRPLVGEEVGEVRDGFVLVFVHFCGQRDEKSSEELVGAIVAKASNKVKFGPIQRFHL